MSTTTSCSGGGRRREKRRRDGGALVSCSELMDKVMKRSDTWWKRHRIARTERHDDEKSRTKPKVDSWWSRPISKKNGGKGPSDDKSVKSDIASRPGDVFTFTDKVYTCPTYYCTEPQLYTKPPAKLYNEVQPKVNSWLEPRKSKMTQAKRKNKRVSRNRAIVEKLIEEIHVMTAATAGDKTCRPIRKDLLHLGKKLHRAIKTKKYPEFPIQGEMQFFQDEPCNYLEFNPRTKYYGKKKRRKRQELYGFDRPAGYKHHRRVHVPLCNPAIDLVDVEYIYELKRVPGTIDFTSLPIVTSVCQPVKSYFYGDTAVEAFPQEPVTESDLLLPLLPRAASGKLRKTASDPSTTTTPVVTAPPIRRRPKLRTVLSTRPNIFQKTRWLKPCNPTLDAAVLTTKSSLKRLDVNEVKTRLGNTGLHYPVVNALLFEIKKRRLQGRRESPPMSPGKFRPSVEALKLRRGRKSKSFAGI